METLTAGDDDVFAHSSRKKSRGVSAGGHTTMLDVNGTQGDKLRRKRKQEKKMMKRRMEEEEEECKKKEKKKKKKKKKEEEEEIVIVVIDEEDEREADSKAPVVIETRVTKKKKKKKHKSGTAEGSRAVETVDNNGLEPAGVPNVKSKKPDRKTNTSAVVTAAAATDCDTPDAALSQEGPWREAVAGGTLPGDPFLRKGRNRLGKEWEMALRKKLKRGENMKLFAELLTYVPDIGSQSPVTIEKMLRYDVLRFRAFREKGIELRMGRFLKRENLKIHENVTNFLELTGIDTCKQLFFPERFPEQTAEIRKLRVHHCFLVRIAEDIPRPCLRVYIRARRIYDDLNYLGRFTEDEDRRLQELQRIHGNSWTTISQGMERSILSVEKRFYMIPIASGPWSQEEVATLVATMKVCLEKLAKENQPDSGGAPEPPWLTKKQLYHKLPWKAISKTMASRSWLQCRVKWFYLLKPKLEISRKGRRSHGVLPEINLIKTLYNMDMEDQGEIDWEQVANGLGDDVVPHNAQQLFSCLKRTRVPHSSILSFCELMDFLHDKVVPRLQKMMTEADFCPLQAAEGQDKYLLSDIFMEEEEFMELDNTR